MRSNGFTLIELLAVIVILAIIALIAVPIVIHIINDTKTSSEKENLNLYTDTVEKTITKKQMNDPYFNPDKCDIKDKGNLECFNGTTSLGMVEINMKGQVPESGTVIIEGNNIKYENIVLNGKTYYEKKIATLENDAAPIGVSYGDKYTYKVNDSDTFNFYVLSVEGDKVNLIMDRNICEDGTVATETNKCTIAWHAGENNNNYGPDTAMIYLYNATKEWTNVANMELLYEDEGHKENNSYGYTSFIVNNGVGTITGFDTSNTVIIGTSLQPLKARLPKKNELEGTDGNHCTKSRGSCPAWLVNYLSDTLSPSDSSFYPENEFILGIDGYWILSSNTSPGVYNIARFASSYGLVAYTNTNSIRSGVRPVITVSLSDLSN